MDKIESEEIEIKRLKREIENLKNVITEHKEAIKEKDETIKEKDETIKEKDKVIKKMEDTAIGASLSLSSIRKFQEAEIKYTKLCDNIIEKFPWRGPSSQKIQEAWDFLRSLPELPDDGSTIKDENKDMHSKFKLIFEHLKVMLPLSLEAKLIQEQSMPDDGVRHDFVLSHRSLLRAGYPDTSVIFELKTIKGDKSVGQLQACNGLVNAVTSSPSDQGADKASIFFNYESAKAYYFEHGKISEGLRTNLLICFPKKWKSIDIPTDGFTLLCHILSAPIKGMHSIKLQDDRVVRCGTTIMTTGSFSVYALNNYDLPRNIPRDREYVVKVLTKPEKHMKGLMKLEIEKNELLHSFRDFRNYTLYYPELKVQDGFAMIGGTPLLAATRKASTESGSTLFNLLKKVSLEIFDALYVMNSHGWFHGDIRPYNIVLDINGNAKLIDFVTADVFGEDKRFYFSQGHFDRFSSAQLIEINNQLHVYVPRWEYESLVYSILFCALNSSSISDAFHTVESRQDFLESSRNSPISILRFCSKFFSLVQGLRDRRPNEEFRAKIISELDSFEFISSTAEE